MQFHMKRIMEWYESIKHGMFLPSFSFNYFHGSAVMSIYPYLSTLPYILIFKLTSSFIISYYLFFIIIIFTSLLISFFGSLNYSKSILISYIFAITYSLSSIFTFKMFVDGELGVITSSIFLPLVLFGFLDIISGSRNYLKMTLGILLVSFCEIPVLVIIIVFLIFWALINIKHMNKTTYLELFKSSILSILLTSLLWVPLLTVFLQNKINTVFKKQLTGFSVKFFIENISFWAVITIILVPFYFKQINYLDKQMYSLSILVIIVSSKFFPWHFITSLPIFKILNQFQFTFRFLIIPQILLSYMFALIIYKFLKKGNNNESKILLSVIIIIIILSQLVTQSAVVHRKLSLINIRFTNLSNVKEYEIKAPYHYSYFIKNNKSMTYLIDGYSNNNDYYPKISKNEIKNINNYRGIYHYDRSIPIIHTGFDRFRFNNNRNIHNLRLPIVIYKGENIKLYLNNHYKRCYDNRNVITIKNMPRGINRIKLKFINNSGVSVLKYILLILGIFWMLIIEIRNKLNNYLYNK